MAEPFCPLFELDDIPGECNPLESPEKDESSSAKSKDVSWSDMEACEIMDSFPSVFGFYQENVSQEKAESLEDRPRSFSEQLRQNDTAEGIMPLEIQENCLARKQSNDRPQVAQPGELLKGKRGHLSFPLASWELLLTCQRESKKSGKRKVKEMSKETNEACWKLSTGEILKMAGERFIESSTNRVDHISMFIDPYGSSLSELSTDDRRDVELVHLLLVATEMVDSRQFGLASKLLTRCKWMVSDSGTPIQRVVFYLSRALDERICGETGGITTGKVNKQKDSVKTFALGTNNTFLSSHQTLPFCQVMQFAGIQAIIENVKAASKIHLIDFQIRSGIQWTALMQYLVDRHDNPIKILKITAVGTSEELHIEETGKRLRSFAESLNLPFSFTVVYLTDMNDFNESLVKIEAEETVAVYSSVVLRSMISRPDCLENVMREIRRMRPVVMVVAEVEANHNSPSFIDRFTETLIFYSAFFDCLEDSMAGNNEHRMIIERDYFGLGILNIVADEGTDRYTRNVKLDVWRAFFARFGMVEMELSESSLYQAELVLRQFAHGNSCTLEQDGKGLIVGWKGTPLHSLTIWKFF